MTRSQSDSWSTARSLAFLAATFAIVLGSLLPFGAMAAANPTHPLVICSADGPMTIVGLGDQQEGGGKAVAAHCPACVMPLVAALPTPPLQQAAAVPAPVRATFRNVESASPPPPARAPPRPPSTAPPGA